MIGRVRVAPVALLLLSSSAWPNGGPMAWNPPAGAGDGAPLAPSSVRLVSEDLTITVGARADLYDVEARYVLSNPGAATTVSYGVPITWGLIDEGEPESAELQKAAAGVSIELGGVKQGCKLRVEQGSPLYIGVPEELGVDSLAVGAWCVTDLKVPSGDKIALTLRYRASTSFVDGESSKSALPSWAPRDLVYPLFPAAGWAGKPAFKMRIDLGPWADDAKLLQPRGAKREGSAWTYSASSADLSAMGTVIARIDVQQAELARMIGTYNAQRPTAYTAKFTARASSTLAGGTYEAANLLDGKIDTAWCEGVAGDGVGETLELRPAPGATMPQHCAFQGLAFVPGYAKSQSVYANNGRVSSVKIGLCGSDKAEIVALKPQARFDRAAAVASLDGLDSTSFDALSRVWREDPASLCLSVSLASVDKGAKYADSCISEIVALVNCG